MIEMLCIVVNSIYDYARTEAGKAIIGGILGNRFDALFKDRVDKVKGFLRNGHLPENEHLLRALQIARLDAIAYFGKAVVRQSAVLQQGGNYVSGSSEIDLMDKLLGTWIKNQKLLVAEKPEMHMASPLYANIELLLARPVASTKALLDNLIYEAKKQAQLELEDGLFLHLPDLALEMLYNGWQENGQELDLFTLMTLNFTTTLKSKGGAQAAIAFETHLLSDIKVETKQISIRVEHLSSVLLERFEPMIEVMRTQWPVVYHWIEDSHKTLQGISRDIHGIHVDLQELLNLYISDKSKAQLMAAPEITSLLQRIVLLRNEIAIAYNNKEEFSKAVEANANDRLLITGLQLATQEWASKCRLLENLEEDFKNLKESITNQKKFFDQLDTNLASERLQRAKELFQAADFSGVRTLLAEKTREFDRLTFVEKKNQASIDLEKLVAEDVLMAESILMQIDQPGRYRAAETMLRQSIIAYPCQINHQKLAEVLFLLGDFNGAILQYEASLLFSENDNVVAINCHIEIARSLISLHEHTKASYHLKKAIQLCEIPESNDSLITSQHVQALSLLGVACKSLLQNEEAKVNFLKASSIAGENFDEHNFQTGLLIYLNLSSAYLLGHDKEKAMLAVNKVEQILPALNLPLRKKNRALGEIFKCKAEILMRDNQFKQAQELLEKALECYQQLRMYNPQNFEFDIAGIYESLGQLAYYLSDGKKALVYYDDAKALLERLALTSPDAYEPALAGVLDLKGELFWREMEIEKAIACKLRAAELLSKYVVKEDLKIKHLDILVSLGDLTGTMSTQHSGVQFLDQALSTARSLQTGDEKFKQTKVAQVLHALGVFYAELNEFSESLMNFEESVSIVRELRSKYGVAYEIYLSDLLNGLGLAYSAVGQYQKGIKVLTESHDIKYRYYESDPETYAETYAPIVADLGNHYRLLEDTPMAVKHYEKALQVYQSQKSIGTEENDLQIANIHTNIGACYERNDIHLALKNFGTALAIYRKLENKNPARFVRHIAYALEAHARLYNRLNDNEKFIVCLQESNILFGQLVAVNPGLYERSYFTGLFVEASTLITLGRIEDAKKVLQKALAINEVPSTLTERQFLEIKISGFHDLAKIYKDESDSAAYQQVQNAINASEKELAKL